METNQENKWHQNPIVVIALIIFLFPVGLYFMWKNELWSKRTRWIVTTIVALAVIANFGDDTASSSSSSNNYSGTYLYEEDGFKTTLTVINDKWYGEHLSQYGEIINNELGIMNGNDIIDEYGQKLGTVKNGKAYMIFNGVEVVLYKE